MAANSRLAVVRDRRALAGVAAGFDRANAAAALADEPEAVAADRVHMGIDHGDRGGHRDHRLDRVAALRENVAPRLGGQRVRRGDGGAGKLAVSFKGRLGLEEGGAGESCARDFYGIGANAHAKVGVPLAADAPINWTNATTLASVAVLVGTELVGAGGAAGWAIGGLFQLGDLLTHALEAVFILTALTGLYYFLRAALAHEPIRG